MSKEITYGFPTHVEKAGELLKICLQKDHKLALYVEGYLLKNIEDIRSVRYIPKKEDLHSGLVCIGQYDDQQYYRIKILDHLAQNQTVNVLFIDYGNFASLPLTDIRLLSYDHQTLLTIPPLAVTCFLEGVNVIKQWNDEELSTLKKFILYEERQCVFRQLANNITVVNIFIATSNKYLDSMIIENDLGTSITDTKLMIIAKGMMPSSPQYSDRADQNRLRLLQQRANEQQAYGQMMPPPQYEPPVNYHTDRLPMPDSSSSMQMLNVGTTHHVYVSHMEEGPYSFFVQLKSNAEDALPRLINLLKQHKPIPHTPPLMPGCMVMTHVLTDNTYRRSIVMNIRHDSCLVYHMDFGNSEDIPCSEIYQLPPQARHAPAMALRFCLSDLKSQQVTDSAKAYFQEFLERKCVLIRVVDEEHGNPLYQYCEMYYDNKNVKEILWTFNSPLEYTNQLHPRGKDVKVTVSVVESPAQFCVQYSSKLDIINNIQEAVNAYCVTQPRLHDLASISIGSPVAALFEDNTWYRAMVVSFNKDSVKVLYVDYGNRSNVPLNNLCQISRELVTKWRTQAVECCLVGFENCGEVSDAISEKMTNKTLGLTYHLRLISILNSSRLLVDLIDNLGGKVSDDIRYTPPTQAIPPYRENPPYFQKAKETAPVISSTHGFDSASVRNKYRIDTSIGTYNDSPKPTYQFFCDSGEQKVKFKADSSFPKTNQRQNSFHSMDSFGEHDNREIDHNKNRGYNRQKSFDKGPRFQADEAHKKAADNFGEEKPPRRSRFGGEDRGGRGSVGSRGSDDFSFTDEKPRRGFGGPRSRPDEEQVTNDDRPRRGGFYKHDDRTSEHSNEDRPRRSFNTRSRTDDDKASDHQFGDDKSRRGFRGQKQDEDKGRGFGGRDKFTRGNNWDASDNIQSGRDDDRKGRGSRFGDEERRGGRDSDERKGGRGNSNRWGGDGDTDERPRRDGNRRGGGEWKREDGEDRRGGGEFRRGGGGEERRSGGDRRSSGEDRRGSGGGGGRRGNWNREEGGTGGGGGGGSGWGGDNRRKKFDNDSTSKRFSQDTSPPKPVVEEDWDDTPIQPPKAAPVPPVPASNAITAYPMHNIPANTEMKVHLSYMQNPHVFYVQPSGSEGDLDEIRKIIEAETEASLIPVRDTSLPLGTPVLARFSLDQLLYRGLIQQVFPPSAQVLFIDYGNNDTVLMSDIFLVAPKLAQKEPLSIRCSLVDVNPPEVGWTADPEEYSQHFEAEEAMTMNVVSVKMIDGEVVVYVKMAKPSGEQVSQLLFQNGLAVPTGKTCTTLSSEDILPSTAVPAPVHIPTEVHQPVDRVPGKIIEPLPDKWIDRFDLLVGQKFYCSILETIEENLFIVSITEAKVITLAAALSDQQHIPLLQPDTKLIIDVKAVREDRLKVVFFTLNGSLMSPKEGTSGRKLSPICPFPVIRRSDHVTVTYCEGAIVYIQRLSDSDRLAQLLDNMYTFYETTKPDSEARWKIGDICAAQSNLDSNWYRAKVINDAEMFNLRFLDYGSTEELPYENLRKLDDKFIFSEMCLSVTLSVYWRNPNPPLLEIVEGEELFAKFTRDMNGQWIVDLTFANGDKVIQELLKRNIATEKSESPFDDHNIIIGSDLTTGDSVPIVVSHDDSITMFWAQVMKHINNIDELQDKLQNIIPNLNEGNPDELKVFTAQYSEDSVWYRATKVGDNTLRFIDYGNTDQIGEHIKELPSEMMKPLSGYAVPMYLCVKPASGEWSEEAIEIHQAFIEKPCIVAKIINVDYKIVVDIEADGKLLSEALIEAGFAEYNDYIPENIRKYLNSNSTQSNAAVVSLDTKDRVEKIVDVENHIINEKEQVFVVLPNSPNDFYIQEESRTDIVDEIQNRLLTVELVEYKGSVEIGQQFAVQSKDDGLMYRAKVISLESGVQVYFIDYGNIVTVEAKDLYILPEDVASIPPIGIHCSLNIEETPEHLSAFLKMTNYAQTPFKIKMKSCGSPNNVSLLTTDGENVLDFLLSHKKTDPLSSIKSLKSKDIEELHLLEEESSDALLQDEMKESLRITMELLEPELNVVKQGYISHINSINDFYIQEISIMTVLDHITAIFSVYDGQIRIKENFKVGELVSAKYNVDDSWCRGIVTQREPAVTVQFIDYGNECEVSEVYELPDILNLEKLAPVAIKCCLSVDDVVLHPKVEEMFLDVSGGGSTLFDFQILSKNGNLKIVELMVEDRNILLDLTEDNSNSEGRVENSKHIEKSEETTLSEEVVAQSESNDNVVQVISDTVMKSDNATESATSPAEIVTESATSSAQPMLETAVESATSTAEYILDAVVESVTSPAEPILDSASSAAEYILETVVESATLPAEAVEESATSPDNSSESIEEPALPAEPIVETMEESATLPIDSTSEIATESVISPVETVEESAKPTLEIMTEDENSAVLEESNINSEVSSGVDDASNMVPKYMPNPSDTDGATEPPVNNESDISIKLEKEPELSVNQKSATKEASIITNGSPAKKVPGNKPVKTVAEIKASAKSRIATGLSKTPEKLSTAKQSTPVTKVKSESQLDAVSPVNDSKVRKSSLPKAQICDDRPVPGNVSSPKPRQSKADKIVPGAILGHTMPDPDEV
ncbi:maternal protein tudor isoform X2 [Halyomorpha halys]|uniref:maternal protein tudor isoform X2 n=1 Tax=Halyomorpha halys TaxID=286706 RepID=UPI0034D26D28